LQNYFEVEPALEARFAEIGSAIDNVVAAGTPMYRARVGLNASFRKDGDFSFTPAVVRQPYQSEAIGAPPPSNATPGRANRDGVSFLYLSSDQTTAAAEIRPHPGHRLSVAEFRAVRDMRIANFAVDIGDFATSDELLDRYHFLYSIDRMFSTPVVPESRVRYTITQVIADILRKAGYDAVQFRSSLGPGYNLCVFRPSLFEWVPDSGRVFSVDALQYSLSDLPSIGEDTAGYSKIG
jgi:hypothetical protein